MARRNDDDDYDDRPRRRRPADDEDDDVDDRVSSRKRPGARGGDYDDEDDYDRPRKKKKAGSKGLIIGLSVGGGVLVLVIVGVVSFLVLRGGGGGGNTQKLLVGTWQLQGAPMALTVQFTADGNFIRDMGLLKMNYKYKVINASTIEVDLLPGGGLGDLMPKLKGMPDFKMPDMPMNVKQNITVNVTQNELTLTENGVSTRYRRVN